MMRDEEEDHPDDLQYFATAQQSAWRAVEDKTLQLREQGAPRWMVMAILTLQQGFLERLSWRNKLWNQEQKE